MSSAPRRLYEFERFRLDATEGALFSGERSIPLPPKAFETLLVLVENGGRLVTKEELIRRVWPDTVVGESTLTQYVFLIRKAMHETADRRLIETVPRRGYRLAVPVTMRLVPDPASDAFEAPAAAGPQPVARRGVRARLVLALVAGAAVLIASIGWLARRGLAPEERPVETLAVLPFRVVVGGEEAQYLGVGLTDALISRLGREAPSIVVRPTTAVLRYGDEWLDPVDAGRLLRVDAVLDGTIQSAEGKIRVHLRLIRVADGKTLLSEDVDGYAGDLFAVEDAIAGRAARYLSNELTGPRQPRLERPTSSSNAYQAYLLGRYFWNRRPDGIQQAIEYFTQALELDPRYAQAYAGLAACHSILPGEDAAARANVLAGHALRLDPTLAEPHVVLAVAAMKNLEWDRAGRALEQALAADPHNAEAHTFRIVYLLAQRKADEAIRAGRRAVELDPTSVNTNVTLGVALMYAGRLDEALEQLEKTVEIEPSSHWVRIRLAQLHIQAGRPEKAIEQAEIVYPKHSGLGAVTLAHAYAVMGREDEARRYLAEATADGCGYRDAAVHAALGDSDEALACLDRLIQERHTDVYALAIDPRLDPLRRDPRFERLLRDAGME